MAALSCEYLAFWWEKIKIQHTKFSSKQSLRQSKKIYETRNFTTTIQIQPSLSYQTEIKLTTLAIPNPKTAFAIASLKKKNLLGKSGNITSGRVDISNYSKTFNKRVAKASQQGATLLFHPLWWWDCRLSWWLYLMETLNPKIFAVVTLLSAFSLGPPYCTRFCLFSA